MKYHLPLALLAACMTGCTTPRPDAISPFLRSSRNEASRPIAWEVVQRFDFDAPAALAGCPQPAGVWRTEDGRLVAAEGNENRALLLCPLPPEPLRVQFQARLEPNEDGKIGDISVLLGATDSKRFFASGYSLTTGSYWNHCTTFYRLGRPLARTEWSPLQPNRWYRVTVERAGGHLRYWLDDQILLDAWDREPLEPAADAWLGLRTWDTRLLIDNLTVSRPESR